MRRDVGIQPGVDLLYLVVELEHVTVGLPKREMDVPFIKGVPPHFVAQLLGIRLQRVWL